MRGGGCVMGRQNGPRGSIAKNVTIGAGVGALALLLVICGFWWVGSSGEEPVLATRGSPLDGDPDRIDPVLRTTGARKSDDQAAVDPCGGDIWATAGEPAPADVARLVSRLAGAHSDCVARVPRKWQIAILAGACSAKGSEPGQSAVLGAVSRSLTLHYLKLLGEPKVDAVHLEDLLACLAEFADVSDVEAAVKLGELLKAYIRQLTPASRALSAPEVDAFLRSLLGSIDLAEHRWWRGFWVAFQGEGAWLSRVWRQFLDVAIEKFSSDALLFVETSVTWFPAGTPKTSMFLAQASGAISPLLGKEHITRARLLMAPAPVRLLYLIAVPTTLRFPGAPTPIISELFSADELEDLVVSQDSDGPQEGAWRANLAVGLWSLAGPEMATDLLVRSFAEGSRVGRRVQESLVLGTLQAIGNLQSMGETYAKHPAEQVREAGEKYLLQAAALQHALAMGLASVDDSRVEAFILYIRPYAKTSESMGKLLKRLEELTGLERTRRVVGEKSNK
jgi:hypothetical protein